MVVVVVVGGGGSSKCSCIWQMQALRNGRLGGGGGGECPQILGVWNFFNNLQF